jgi:hypothetical protein
MGTEAAPPRRRAAGRRLAAIGLGLAATALSGLVGWQLGEYLGAAGRPALAPILFLRGGVVVGLLGSLVGLWLLRRRR